VRRLGLMVALAAIGAASALLLTGAVAHHNTANAYDPSKMPEIQQRLVDGVMSLDYDMSRNSGNDQFKPNNYFPRGNDTCPVNLSSNIKVNQDCLNLSDPDLQGRAQAQNETTIAVDPFDTNDLIAASNDYRIGDGGCFPSYSLDGGRTWNDTALPYEFTRGDSFGGYARQYWQSCGDPFVIGYDTKGNAYFGGLMFNRGIGVSNNPDQGSAVYVWRSTQNSGASWNFPGRPVVETDNTQGLPFNDKPQGTIDNNSASPYANRIYVTWTDFGADGTAYILEAYSSDYGEHFSAPHVVSINSPLCTNTYGLATPNGDCNENQFSQPFVAPNGNLYVVYDNYNNPTKSAQDNENQVLLSESVDGGNTFTPPVKVASYYDLPDCATYQNGQDLGRACVPEKGPTSNSIFRAINYPVGAVNPTNPSQVVVTFGSYINRYSNEANGCVPAGFSPVTGNNLYTGVKTPGACNNKILESVSNDGGATFTGTTTDPRQLPTVNQDPGQVGTDQFWQWMAFTKDGKLAVSYYDRQYGSDETTGYSDVSLSGSGDLANFVVERVTSSSMPPPTEFSGLFMGDYSGLAVADKAWPLWTDTRDPDLFVCPSSVSSSPAVCGASETNGLTANDQDIFTENVSVPSK
jgi:hypothetical protein